MGQVEARPDICTSSSEKVAVPANLSLPLPPATERLEPEGIDEADSTAGGFSSSLLAVDKRVFGRLQVSSTRVASMPHSKENYLRLISYWNIQVIYPTSNLKPKYVCSAQKNTFLF